MDIIIVIIDRNIACKSNVYQSIGILMKNTTQYYRKIIVTYVQITLLAMIVSAFFLPSFMKFEKTGNNIFTVFLNEKQVGVVGYEDEAEECLREARLLLASSTDELVLAESELRLEGREVLFGKVDSHRTVAKNMEATLRDSIKKTVAKSYTVKINEYTVNLDNAKDVEALLQASVDKYDTDKVYDVELVLDPTRELNVLTTKLIKKDEIQEESPIGNVGISAELDKIFAEIEPTIEKEFSDFELGLKELSFGNPVEVVEAYLMQEKITPLEQAIEEVTKDREKEQIYEVVGGDTLSGIAMDNNLTMEALVQMNESIEDENSTIRIGDEIIITVPEPELSVTRLEEVYYEEDYEEEIIYVDNDNWFITEQVTLQEPSAGHRKVVANVSYRNDAEESREIIKEEVVIESVPKIVERGTKIPPTYIKPLSGGRMSSQYGGRKAPVKGASSFHKAIDWACPIGTAIMASSSGTVSRAGWGSGYGYVVYIDHADGKQTRYGHLSKVLVKPGQVVKQGQKIALSGNTGRSSGPHIHFEILVGGRQVNPLNYLN